MKRSRLRGDHRGKGRMVVAMVLAGTVLLLGHHFFRTLDDNPGGTGGNKQNRSDTSLLDDRGTIYDRNFKELAVTLDKVSLYANVRDIEMPDVVRKLAPMLDTSEDVLRSLIERESYRAWLAKNISQEEEEKVTKLGLKGVFFHKEKARYYPQGQTAAHIVGYVGKSMGLAGVEFHYNSLLNRYGTSLIESGAEEVKEKNLEEKKGQRLVLTMDLKIQKILERFIGDLTSNARDSRVAALLMESKTGKIIGCANYPSYDPNSFHDVGREDLENILIEPVLVPHSLQRIFWDASLLQSQYEKRGGVLPWSISNTRRSLGSQLRLWDRLGLNDAVSVDFVKKKGDLVGPGFLYSAEKGVNTYDSVVDVATPLHIAIALNGLVSGKPRVSPYVIERISGKDGRSFKLFQERAEKDAVAPAVAGELAKLLKGQMVSGPLNSSFFEADSVSYSLNGKLRHYEHNKMLVSFIPRNEPELMLFVFANLPTFSPTPAETKSKSFFVESAQKALIPMVAMQEVMSNLSDMMTVEEKKEMNFELQKEIDSRIIVEVEPKQETFGTMPNLKGYSLRKSLRELKDLKFEIQISGTGVVVEQYPAAGKQVRQGELCRLVLKPH